MNPSRAIENSAQGADETRFAARTKICLLAVLKMRDTQLAVKIRDLSATGALVHGNSLPPSGAHVELVRGSLGVAGKVIWSEDGRCGVKFAERLKVKDWMANATVHQTQNRTDRVVAQIRESKGPDHSVRPQPRKRFGLGIIEGRLADEIGYAIRLIEVLGDGLANEPALLARHAVKMQGLDVAAQILGHVARILVAEDKAAAAESIGMESMRGRVLRRSI